jgi:TolB protein
MKHIQVLVALMLVLLIATSACQIPATPSATLAPAPEVTDRPTALAFTVTPVVQVDLAITTTSDLTASGTLAAPIRAVRLTPPIERTQVEGMNWMVTYSPDNRWMSVVGATRRYARFTVEATHGSLAWLVLDGTLEQAYASPSQFRWSPDGRFLYYYGHAASRAGECDPLGNNTEPYRLDLQSGEITPLIRDLPGPLEEFAISPSAHTLAYFDPDPSAMRLVLHDLETGQDRRLGFETLSTGEWVVGDIVWSPDERALAFPVLIAPCNQLEDRSLSVVVVDVAGMAARTLLAEQRGLLSQLEWADSQILLVHTVTGVPQRLDVRSGEFVYVTEPPTLSASEGDALGWLTFISAHEGYPAIYAIRPNGDRMKRLSGDLSNLFADLFQPTLRLSAWSPDGARIAFDGDTLNKLGHNVFVAHVDGSGREDLTHNTEYNGQPAWSPDGQRIIYLSQSGFTSGDLYVMPAPSNEASVQARPTQLTDSMEYESDPAWSPDGATIAFVSSRNDQNGTDLYLIDATGDNLRRLTDDIASERDLAWSPDARRLAFVSNRGGNPGLFTLDIKMGTVIPIAQFEPTNSLDGNSSPIWAPDGKYIAYLSTRGGQTGIYVTRADESGEWLVGKIPAWTHSLYWGTPPGLSQP